MEEDFLLRRRLYRKEVVLLDWWAVDMQVKGSDWGKVLEEVQQQHQGDWARVQAEVEDWVRMQAEVRDWVHRVGNLTCLAQDKEVGLQVEW